MKNIIYEQNPCGIPVVVKEHWLRTEEYETGKQFVFVKPDYCEIVNSIREYNEKLADARLRVRKHGSFWNPEARNDEVGDFWRSFSKIDAADTAIRLVLGRDVYNAAARALRVIKKLEKREIYTYNERALCEFFIMQDSKNAEDAESNGKWFSWR